MKTYEKNILDRKVLVKRIEELTGQKSKYSFAPRMAYLFEGCAVEKDGTLTTEDTMDQSVINTLIAEGLIKGGMPEAATEAEETEEQEANATEYEEVADDAEAPEEPDGITAEAVEPETADDGADSLTISLPMDRHTPESLRRLLNMIYSRGQAPEQGDGRNLQCGKGTVGCP